MSLVNELIKDLLPEKQEYGKTIAAYGGGFKPATKGHFEVVKQALKQNPEIDEFIIFIGGKERDGITKEEATLIWDLYEKYLPMGKIKISSSDKPPIRAIYNYASDNPTEKVLFILGAREGNEDDFSDITNRTKSLGDHPNMSLRTIVTQEGASGTAARNALKVSYEKFKSFLPNELDEKEKKMIYNMLSKKYVAESLEDWFEKEDWVRINTSGNITGPCGTMKKGKPTTRCLPRKKAQSLTKAERKATVAKKVRGSKKGKQFVKNTKKGKVSLNEMLNPKEFDFKPHIKSLTIFMEDNGLKLQPYPKIRFIHSDVDNGTNLLGKTAYYTPDNNEVVLYTYGRHPKDILRSYAHELVHVHQNMEDRLEHTKTTNVNQDDYLKELEKEAYETGNILFRSWSDTLIKEGKKSKKKVKDPFGIMAYAAELGRLREEEKPKLKVYLDMDGVLADFDKRFKDLSGYLPQPFVDKYGLNAFWDLIDEKHKVAFWRGIEVMPGAKQLVDAAKEYDYELLTAPSVKKQSRIGKNLWVQDKVGILFGSKPKVNFRKAKEKHMIKPELTKNDVLIDDRADTIERWERAGGTGIQYFTANQAISDLKDLKV